MVPLQTAACKPALMKEKGRTVKVRPFSYWMYLIVESQQELHLMLS
ncbi:hypothetical protein JOC77_003493 [Peribacillus deserti]|uniref:Uncharacterized protein n=1 Tax=Peribacillus deserti TaxID=673318 RepID=A0ABS2QMS3_9BACI|nr:hypothetical protein [Peribacillus deserti]